MKHPLLSCFDLECSLHHWEPVPFFNGSYDSHYHPDL